MHWRGESKDMQSRAIYSDVVKEVRDELSARIDDLIDHGVNPEQIVMILGLDLPKPANIIGSYCAISIACNAWISRSCGSLAQAFLGDLVGATSPDDRDFCYPRDYNREARKGVWAVRTHSV